jgi:hypothetical protein
MTIWIPHWQGLSTKRNPEFNKTENKNKKQKTKKRKKRKKQKKQKKQKRVEYIINTWYIKYLQLEFMLNTSNSAFLFKYSPLHTIKSILRRKIPTHLKYHPLPHLDSFDLSYSLIIVIIYFLNPIIHDIVDILATLLNSNSFPPILVTFSRPVE